MWAKTSWAIRPVRVAIVAILITAGTAHAADDITVTIHKATQEGPGESLGIVTITSGDGGAQFALALHGLPPGPHGFHVHQNADCGPTVMNGVRIPAGAAGGHWDPEGTGKHEGPNGAGHLGDLPVLQANNDGTANQTLTAPRIKNIDVLRGHALVIHVGGDNYSDEPVTLGGGGLRFACGAIPK
jgi:superoxide dismutase, Cu-Zn family